MKNIMVVDKFFTSRYIVKLLLFILLIIISIGVFTSFKGLVVSVLGQQSTQRVVSVERRYQRYDLSRPTIVVSVERFEGTGSVDDRTNIYNTFKETGDSIEVTQYNDDLVYIGPKSYLFVRYVIYVIVLFALFIGTLMLLRHNWKKPIQSTTTQGNHNDKKYASGNLTEKAKVQQMHETVDSSGPTLSDGVSNSKKNTVIAIVIILLTFIVIAI